MEASGRGYGLPLCRQWTASQEQLQGEFHGNGNPLNIDSKTALQAGEFFIESVLKGCIKGVEKSVDGQLIISDADALAKERQTASWGESPVSK